MEITKEDLEKTMTAILDSSNKELFEKKESELEEYWFFKWDVSATLEWNLYQFHDLLKLYGNFCRRWEEKHHGHVCVVERVRDKYLMPKIREFILETKHNIL